MVIRIVKIVSCLLVVAALCFAFYQVGQTVGEGKAKVQIVEKEVKVIKYVEKKKAEIYSKPNLSRDSLLDLMHKNSL